MGYFACGWPKTYLLPDHHGKSSQADFQSAEAAKSTSSHPPHPVHAIHLDPSSRYVLTVSARALHIWNARQHRILLARFVISDLIKEEEGPLVDAVWSPSSKAIIAAFRNGLVLLFSVQQYADRSLLHFNLPNDQFIHPPNLFPLRLSRVTELRIAHADSHVTCLTTCPAGALISTSSSALACISWDAEILWRAHVPELLRHNNAMAKMGVTQTIDISSTSPSPADDVILKIQQEEAPDSIGGIIALTYNQEVGFCGIVLGDGPALLLAMHSAGRSRPSAIDGRWLRCLDSVSIALEPRRMLATVGLRNGDVEQYYIGVPAGDQCPLMRTISLANWYFEAADIGRPLVLQWTDDGGALVVGWERTGLAVWSVSGCRLMWTLPQVGGPLPTTPASRNRESRSSHGTSSPLDHGVSAVAWGPKGFFLWASPRVTPENEFCHFMEFTFLKNGMGGSICQSDSSRLALLGSDRVLILRHASEGNQGSNYVKYEQQQNQINADPNDLFSWQHLLIPHDYLWRNWPPTNLAVNFDASHIAVAGEYGVAICHVRSQRWRVFADLEHGKRIKCCALAWVGKTIVIGNEIILSNRQYQEEKKYELLFYLRDQSDSTTLQTQRNLPSKPLLTDVRADGYLLVMCEDARVFLFKMTENYSRSRVDVREVYNLLLPTREAGHMYQQDLQSKNSNSIAMAAAAAALAATANGSNVDEELSSFSSTFHNNIPPAPGGGITEAKIFPPLTHARGSASIMTASSSMSSNNQQIRINENVPVPTHIMLLRSTGSLILLDTDKMVSTALLRYVERFWYTPEHCTPFNMMAHQPVWWAYGDDGLHVCFKDVRTEDDVPNRESDGMERMEEMSPRVWMASSRKKKVQVEQWFELDAEVYPLAIMPKYGMLLGATQGLIVNSVNLNDLPPMPRHSIQVKRQPILHTLLRYILMRPEGDERLALQVALKCVSQPQFVDSLEWLLYEAVLEHDDESIVPESISSATVSSNGHVSSSNEDDPLGADKESRRARRSIQHASIAQGFPESPKRKKAGSGLFPRVIRLLKYFGEYEDVVVRCARKLDSKRWPLLFSLAGEPAALLEQCFVSGRLRTAACLLVILQEMWGFISSTPHSLRLVEAALACGEIDLAADLSNFLLKADRAGMLNSSQLRSIEDVSWIADVVSVHHAHAQATSGSKLTPSPSTDSLHRHRADRIAAVDAAVLNHARWLLSRMDLRNLVHVAIKMDFPLHEWLKRELKGKNASRPFVRDFGNTIIALHRQFQCPQPNLMDVRQAMKVFNLQLMDASGSGSSTSEHPTPPLNLPVSSQRVARVRNDLPSRRELSYLMTVARMARVPDLTLCCATLLLDIFVVRMILRGHEELFGPYIAALNEFNVSGYDALTAVMNEVALPK